MWRLKRASGLGDVLPGEDVAIRAPGMIGHLAF